LGYYGSTTVQDAIKFHKACQACQIHADFIHQPPQLLYPSILSWPFHAWDLDVIGPLKPTSSHGHIFILTATGYFSKWAEAISLREVGAKQVADLSGPTLFTDMESHTRSFQIMPYTLKIK